jgi:dTDP-glucose pyrophosphorylase
MEKKNIEKFTINELATLADCLNKINLNGHGSLIITNKNDKVLGTITDGDIRRSILKKEINLASKIKSIYNRKPYLVKKIISNYEIKQTLFKKNIFIIPLVDKKKKLLDVYLPKNSNIKNNISVIIMAGGKGLRMKPFTNFLPKALLPFKQSTIIEEIINKFSEDNFFNFIITTGTKSEILKKYLKKNKLLSFYKEKKPLGTVGCISRIKSKLTNTFILSNCDTFADINYNDLLTFHKNSNNFITIVCAMFHVHFEYGICDIKPNGLLKKIREKPKYEHYINTGIYVFNKEAANFIPNNKVYNMNDLINFSLNKKKKIGIYPIASSLWKDVGNWKEYYKNLSFNLR